MIMDDSDVVKAINICERFGITVHVRGTDERPIVEFKRKGTRSVIGGSELKRMFESAKECGWL